MAATTPAAIRAALVAIVEALTPTTDEDDKFREHREELPFRDWLAANVTGCLRRFSLRWSGDVTGPEVSNQSEEFVTRALDCIIAYPTSWRAGGTQLAGLDDLIMEDVRQIANAIGTNGHAAIAAALAPASACITTDGEGSDDLGPVHVGVVRLTARYYRRNP